MRPTVFAATVVAAIGVAAVFFDRLVIWGLLIVVGALVAADVWLMRRSPEVDVALPAVLARGIAAPIAISAEQPLASRIAVRQPVPADLRLDLGSSTENGEALGTIVATRRGRHRLPEPAVRSTGPFSMASTHHRAGGERDVIVYPDVVTARRIAVAVRTGLFRDPAQRARGRLGLGTDFESVRDYVPDDDIRQVNWRATARTGRPMSNQYRVEQGRDVLCVVDAGRLMTAPVGDLTRLDAALDAVAAIALTADVVGDRCGVIVFDSGLVRSVAPTRRGASGVIEAVFDVEPREVESDYELAFREVNRHKRALVVFFTDLFEPTAAQPLVRAMPTVGRRHAIVVGSVTDPDLSAVVDEAPASPADVARMAIAVDALAAERQAARDIAHRGAQVVRVRPKELQTSAVGAYLRAKSTARV